MNKKTKYGKDSRDAILEGVKKIVSAIKVTLGPTGRNVVVAQSAVVDYGVHSLPLHVTKDGYTVARSFDLDDPFEKPGILFVKEACQKTVDEAGDGTTTCAVLLEAIVSEGAKLIDSGANPMELKRGIDKAVEYVVEQLKAMATPVKGNIETIRQIATISANNDSSIGDLIAKAFEKIGDEGIIDLEASKSVNTEIKIADGYKFSKGWVSHLFVNNKEKQICEFEEPVLLLYEKRINHHTQVQKALELAIQMGNPIIIICEEAEQEGLAFLAMNTLQGRIRCCVITAPDYGDTRRESMEDIATITGGVYLSDAKGYGIKEVTDKQFGRAKKVIISKDETVIIGGEGKKESVENLLNELRMNLAQAKNEDEKAPIEKRIAKLTGGVAVIQVGAATETEMKERLDRFDDAVRATKAAIGEGYVMGGGMVFLRTGGTGSGVIDKAMDAPFRQICDNAGVSYLKIMSDMAAKDDSVGYNAKENRIEDLLAAGVIDPVKVLRCALQNAASSAGMILTCECAIVDTL